MQLFFAAMALRAARWTWLTNMTTRRLLLFLALLAALQPDVYARGVTPYLPLNLDPELERAVERVLILGDKPVMTRPIPAAVVLDALPKACEVDAVLCERVRRALKPYMQDTAVEFVSVEGAITNGADTVLPNQHGATAQSPYQVAGAGYIQPSDYALVNVGGVAYQGRETATGSFLSLGFDWAQLDLGYRDHWWSPLTDSSMLISTEAPTMPSVTLSNYAPFTRWGLQYEVFAAHTSYTRNIELINGQLTQGNPKFTGIHLGMEPENSGWSLAANRVLMFGGGAAGGQSLSDIFQALFNPTKGQTTVPGSGTPVLGKQEASLTSRFIFPGKVPFSVYFEYAGNDSSGSSFSFSKTDFSAGIHFPRVGPFDLTYEFSEWQPSWYVKSATATQTGYGDGITNYLLSIGHWFGDQRVFGDAVGGQSNMLRLGWEPRFGGLLEAQLRSLTNDSFYSAIAYHHAYTGSLTYSYPWRDYVVGTEVDYGRDVYGASYTRLAGFLRYGDALQSGLDSAEEDSGASRSANAEIFVDAGVVANRVLASITSDTPRIQSGTDYGPHVALGARRAVSEHQDLGVAVEVDDIQGLSLVSARLLDYRYRFPGPLALNVFAGAARYATATPAYGFYFGVGPQWRNILPHWDLGIDYRYASKVDRVRSLPSDPQGGYRPDAYYDISMVTLYVSRKF
jgi:hypothetical protein